MRVRLVAYNAKGRAVYESKLVHVRRNTDIDEMFAACQQAGTTATGAKGDPAWLSILNQRGREISGCDC